MIIQGQLKDRDYVAAKFLNLRARPLFFVVGILLLALVVFVAIWTKSPEIFAFLGIFVFCFFYAICISPKKFFHQYKAMSEPVTVQLREDGLFFKRTNGEGLVPWNDLLKWRSNEKLVLLYPAANLFYLIPRHFFQSESDYGEFLVLLKSKLGNAR